MTKIHNRVTLYSESSIVQRQQMNFHTSLNRWQQALTMYNMETFVGGPFLTFYNKNSNWISFTHTV